MSIARSRSPFMPSHEDRMDPNPDKRKVKKAPNPVSVHFLGTCSGGGPIVSRQCSSLAVDFGNNIWLFDAADGTNNRLHQSSLRMVNISRIFITHMHADHVLGIVAILAVVMSGVGTTEAGLEKLRKQGVNKKAEMNIYGPVGMRQFVRKILEVTKATLAGVFAIHELIPEGGQPSVGCTEEELHVNEGVGQDIYPNPDGVWDMIVNEGQVKGQRGWSVSAGPLVHRVPSVGYCLKEPEPRHPLDHQRLIPLLQSNAKALSEMDPPVKHPLSILSLLTALPPPPPFTLPSGEVLYPPEPTGEPGRKLVIFGDCSGGTPNSKFQEMCGGASLLIHECTNAAIPESVQKGDKGRLVRASGLEQSLEGKRNKEFAQSAKDRGTSSEPWVFLGRHDTPALAAAAEEEFEKKRAVVRTKAQSRGHSTPQDVGAFAYAIGARRVVVNHFSAMFPSPKYPTNDPFAPLLSPTSPFPYPTTTAAIHAADVPPRPLTSEELHCRVIMQSLANQISAEWNGPDCAAHVLDGPQQHTVYLAVPARDFMVVRVPSHELTDHERETLHDARREIIEVMQSWADHGGAWVEEEQQRRWVGL